MQKSMQAASTMEVVGGMGAVPRTLPLASVAAAAIVRSAPMVTNASISSTFALSTSQLCGHGVGVGEGVRERGKGKEEDYKP